jgi:hypothetical protein
VEHTPDGWLAPGRTADAVQLPDQCRYVTAVDLLSWYPARFVEYVSENIGALQQREPYFVGLVVGQDTAYPAAAGRAMEWLAPVRGSAAQYRTE